MLSVNRDEFRRPFDVTRTCSLGARRHNLGEAPGGTPYICHIGVCRPNGYGFCAVLVLNRVWFSRELRERISVSLVSVSNK